MQNRRHFDECLQRVAQKIMDSVGRENDIPARYGGEEVVVLMPDTGLDGAKGTNIAKEQGRSQVVAGAYA